MKTNSNELLHYGVLGMKWGRRRGMTKHKPSQEHVEAKNLRQKKASELSNAELRKLTERINLESQYKQLNKKQLTAGKKFVMDLALKIAKEHVTSFITQQVKAQMSKRMGV